MKNYVFEDYENFEGAIAALTVDLNEAIAGTAVESPKFGRGVIEKVCRTNIADPTDVLYDDQDEYSFLADVKFEDGTKLMALSKMTEVDNTYKDYIDALRTLIKSEEKVEKKAEREEEARRAEERAKEKAAEEEVKKKNKDEKAKLKSRTKRSSK